MNKLMTCAILASVLTLTGCLGPKAGENGYVDEEGFTWRDGRVAPGEATSDYYVIRYEAPSRDVYEGSRKVFPKYDFVELRQLKDGTTVVKDGVLSKSKTNYPGRNWMRHLTFGCRNIRVKFVDADYTLAADGVKAAPDGFVSNFNGKDLAGWRGLTREGKFNDSEVRRALIPEDRWALQAKADKLMQEHWHVRDGALFFDGLKDGYSIAAAKDYGNFEVYADWRLLRVFGDSGFYVRGMPQIQIWDPNMWQGLGSGCLWNNKVNDFAAKVCADRPIGSWNTTRIKVVGDRVSVWVNGALTVDAVKLENNRHPDRGIPLADTFELQCHGDPVEFRNIFIRELPEAAEDIPDPSKAVRGEKVDLLAGGMSGWEAVDPKARMGWSLKDGVLRNETGIDPKKTSRGGAGTTHLRTKRTDFFDFDLAYDVLVPAKCNSGVYLRGRYELQVNDSYGRKIDCHNMAALYDLITPTAAAEKPAGEWQHVDVTLYRRHLTVTLNGVKIIDNQPVPGVTPGAIDGNEFAPGPILLQGDHSNAAFKNVILTKIER